MNLKLLYITNRPDVAMAAEGAGVDRIFIDLETIGKDKRQAGRDTVKSLHSVSDIAKVKNVLNESELLVRINPINTDSKEEISKVIDSGADIIMLPMITEISQVQKFIGFVDNRCKTCLLIETRESAEKIDEILKVSGASEYFIGLNDLHLSYDQSFMFEPLADGTVENLCSVFRNHGIENYGFGGIARVGEGLLPAERIIAEHHRLGSTMVILSRTFCDVSKFENIEQIEERMRSGVDDIRDFERTLGEYSEQDYISNTEEVIKGVKKIKEIIESRKELG